MEERLLVELGGDRGVGKQRLDLGAEQEAARRPCVVKRLDPEPIACEKELPPARVPDRDREHALEALDAAWSLLLVEVDDRLGVALGAVAVTSCLELGSE